MTTRRSDPDRRDRIIGAALDLIAEEGVAGTSHRRVAARADVPLGSMTYHFANMDELLREVFERFVSDVATRFETRLAQANTLVEAREAVADIVRHEANSSPRDLVLTHELYSPAARVPQFREITQRWMLRSRTALEQHFDSTTARQLDAVIEGLSIHRALDVEPYDHRVTVLAINRITAVRPPTRGRTANGG